MIILRHPTGLKKECPTGYSWTTFFFGFFVPFFRGDLKWGLILLIITLLLTFAYGLGPSRIIEIIFAFFYNELYIKDLIEKGYIAYDEAAAEWLKMKGIIVLQEISPLQIQENYAVYDEIDEDNK